MSKRTYRRSGKRRRENRRRLTPSQVAELRKKLLAKRDEFAQELAPATEQPLADKDGLPAKDMADLAGSELTFQPAVELGRALTGTVAEIDTALAKLDNGTYGTCEDCGRRIPLARLRAIPWASRCVACQEDIEQERLSPELSLPRRRLTHAFAWPDEEDPDERVASARGLRL